MRQSLTCECVYNAQVDPTLTSFVTAASEISSVTDPTYGPDHSSGLGESTVSSLTDPSYGTGSGGQAGAGSGESAIAVADAAAVGVGVNGGTESGRSAGTMSSPDSDDAPTWNPPQSANSDGDSATWTWDFPEKYQRSRDES